MNLLVVVGFELCDCFMYCYGALRDAIESIFTTNDAVCGFQLLNETR